VNIYDVVVAKSGRLPNTFTVYVPAGLNYDTNIFPLVGSTLIKSVDKTSLFPFKLSYPE
jgi:hypothetical protein